MLIRHGCMFLLGDLADVVRGVISTVCIKHFNPEEHQNRSAGKWAALHILLMSVARHFADDDSGFLSIDSGKFEYQRGINGCRRARI